MLIQILSLTALLSFLSLGLIAEEVSSVEPAQEIEEQSSDENKLACACKKKKTNACKPVVIDEDEKTA